MHLSELDLDCAACSDSMKIYRGCEKDSPIPDKWHIGDITLQRCPKKVITQDTADYLQAYNRYKNGMLPNTGGWLEQSAKFNDVINIIEAEIAIIQKEKARDTVIKR